MLAQRYIEKYKAFKSKREFETFLLTLFSYRVSNEDCWSLFTFPLLMSVPDSLSQIVHNMTFDMIPRSSSLLNINLTLSAVQWPLHHVTTWHRLHIIISLLGKVSIKEKFIGWERNVKFSIQKLSTKGGVWVIKDPWKFQNFFFRLPWTHQNPYSCL